MLIAHEGAYVALRLLKCEQRHKQSLLSAHRQVSSRNATGSGSGSELAKNLIPVPTKNQKVNWSEQTTTGKFWKSLENFRKFREFLKILTNDNKTVKKC